MRYLVKARVKAGQEKPLLNAIGDGSLGYGSIAGDEYIYDLQQARVGSDGIAHWVETCFCATPLAEETPHWEKYFELLSVKDAHNRKNCRHPAMREHRTVGMLQLRLHKATGGTITAARRIVFEKIAAHKIDGPLTAA